MYIQVLRIIGDRLVFCEHSGSDSNTICFVRCVTVPHKIPLL